MPGLPDGADVMAMSVCAVANEFLDRADAEGRRLTHQKLQKLVYIAHGWHLAMTGQPLFPQPVEAWPNGVTIPDLYREFVRYRDKRITGRARTLDFDTLELVPDAIPPDAGPVVAEVIDGVWEAYKDDSGPILSTLTSQPDTAYDVVSKAAGTDYPRGLPIPNDVIRDSYLRIAAERRAARAR